MARDSSVTRDDNYFAGDDRVFRWTVYDRDDVSTQVALDITGYTLDWELKLNESDASPLISRSAFAPSAPALGQVEVTLLDTETETLAEATYVYTLRRVDAGFERVLAFGGFHIRRAILTT